MITEERRTLILKKLSENRFVQVSDLAEEFEVSAVTIRRDLDSLEEESLCIRKHGGAIRVNPGVTLEMPYDVKRHEMVIEKEQIAKQALNLIEDGDTFILDSGSTTYALALLLTSKIRMTVVTNDLKIAIKLAENPKIKIICTGGIARSSIFSLDGAIAESLIRNIHVDKTFLSADAIHHDGVISNVNVEEVAVKQAMVKAAETTILLADSSKFEKSGFAKICDLKDFDILITDSGISDKARVMIKSTDVKSFFV
jgi:DeoR/GlpR family transcriptional regulator of sugar metabolism